LFGVAKAKYYLMTADFIDGREAERIGLVSLCVPAEQLMERILSTVSRLAHGSQTAIRATKNALNNWMRLAGPILDNSLELDMLGFLGSDVREGVAAARDRRAPTFPRPPARAEPSARIALFKGAVSRLRHPADRIHRRSQGLERFDDGTGLLGPAGGRALLGWLYSFEEDGAKLVGHLLQRALPGIEPGLC
jgi:hypothetical protein